MTATVFATLCVGAHWSRGLAADPTLGKAAPAYRRVLTGTC